ncbi:hypothetical protein QQP08_004876 [Theobroma cacao]|nr:hypothetical protein QQP08_004876 [Theobroma cacao]
MLSFRGSKVVPGSCCAAMIRSKSCCSLVSSLMDCHFPCESVCWQPFKGKCLLDSVGCSHCWSGAAAFVFKKVRTSGLDQFRMSRVLLLSLFPSVVSTLAAVGHKELALRLIQNDKNLVRVKGRKGETPLHYVITTEQNLDLLDGFLEACPECIRDMTTANQTALHIATENNRLGALYLLSVIRLEAKPRRLYSHSPYSGRWAQRAGATSQAKR